MYYYIKYIAFLNFFLGKVGAQLLKDKKIAT